MIQWYKLSLFPQIFVPHTGAENQSIHGICEVSYWQMFNRLRAMQFLWLLMSGLSDTSSHSLCLLLKRELLFVMNFHWMSLEWGAMFIRGSLASSSIISPHHDQASLNMHLQTRIKWVWTYTCRLILSDRGERLVGHDDANIKAMIEWFRGCIWSAWSIELGQVLGGGESGGVRLEGRGDGS
jgi:hypothetical protein